MPATKSSRRKMALATLRSLNSTRMEQLVRLRVIRRHKRDAMDVVDKLFDDEAEIRTTIDALGKRLHYEIASNKDLLHVNGEPIDDAEEG